MAASMNQPLTIGIDLGGTNIKGGVIDAAGRALFVDALTTEAAAGFKHSYERLLTLIARLPAAAGVAPEAIDTLGIGVPGPMSRERGFIYNAPNLPGWENIALRDLLHEATGYRVVVENDANAAGFGEFVAGAGRQTRHLVLLTLGTGIGGAVVLDGRLWTGAFDNAGEIGHTIVQPEGRACTCGQTGCLERYSSALAIGERYVEAHHAGRGGDSRAAAAMTPENGSRIVAERAERGDELARRIWSEACTYLALACVNLQHLLNPQVIVLGGGLIDAGDQLLRPVREAFERLTWKIAPDRPEIRLATLGGQAGMIGAAALARV